MDSNQCKAKGGKFEDGKCVFPKTESKQKVKYTPKRILLMLLIIAGLGVSMILLINLGTILHEIAGHVLIAKMMGCKAEGAADIFIGTTTFYDCPLGEKTAIPCDSAAQCNDNDTSTDDHCEEGVCIHEKKMFGIIIAFAPIFIVFFVGMAIWIFLNENSIARVAATIMLFYSCIPSAFPLMASSDMAYAISQGFPVWIAWLIAIPMFGIFSWVLIDEMTDTEFFRAWLE